eukprot:COSAG01_NODE_18367_length_1080_cov_9.255861_1_plen_49_part_10
MVISVVGCAGKKKKGAPLFQNVQVLELSSGAIELQYNLWTSVFKYNCNV